MHRSLRFWLAIGASLLFLGLFFARIDPGETWAKLGEANYLLVPPAIAVYFAAVYFRSLRWQYLLSPMKRLAVARLYPVVVVGYMANNLLPVRLGEVVRAYYLGEREKVSKVSSLATIAVERVFDGLTLLFLAAVVSLFLPLVGLLQGLADRAGVPWVLLALAMSMPFVLVAAFMVLASYSPRWFEVLLERLIAVLPAPIRPKGLRAGWHVHQAAWPCFSTPDGCWRCSCCRCRCGWRRRLCTTSWPSHSTCITCSK